EMWDLSLVDPDNRRPVVYEKRRRLLSQLLERARDPRQRRDLAEELVKSMEDGRIKLHVTALALRCRRTHPGMFSVGAYSAIEAVGPQSEHIFSFVRRHAGKTALVAAPRLVAKLLPDPEGLPHGSAVWGETMLPVPEDLAIRSWHSLFTGETLTPV